MDARDGEPTERQWMTPAEARRALHLSPTGLRHLTDAGRLTVERDPTSGARRFRRPEVLALARDRMRTPRTGGIGRSHAGILAARAFALLDGGADWRDVVRELEVEPRRARELAEEHRSDRHVVLAPELVAELAAEGLAGPDGVVRPRTILATIRTLRARVAALRAQLREEGRR